MFAKAPSQQTQRITGLQVSDQQMGQVIPYVFGHCRTAHKLIYYSNFQIHQQNNSQKKGGKAGTTNWYSVNADFILGYGPFERGIATWENSTWYSADYASQTFTGAGTSNTFSFTISHSAFIAIMGVALVIPTYSASFSDYVDPFTTNAFTISGTGALYPLYNSAFPLPNYGNIAYSGLPYAYYNYEIHDAKTVIVNFPTPATNPQVVVYYAFSGANNLPPNNNTGKKGGGNLPFQNGGLPFERILGQGSTGNPLTYPEFSGDGGANIALGTSAAVPHYNYEVKALFGMGNTAPVSTYTSGVSPGDPGQYTARTTSGDCSPADIMIDLICSGNREPGDTNMVWQHGLGFSTYVPGPTDAYWAYSRYGGILKDEPSISGSNNSSHTYYFPTTFTNQYGDGYSTPGNVWDNPDPTQPDNTAAVGTIRDDGTSAIESWQDFQNYSSTVGNNAFLRVDSFAEANSDGYVEVTYTFDAGATWHVLYHIDGPGNYDNFNVRYRQTDSVLIPSGTLFGAIAVKAECNAGGNSWYSGNLPKWNYIYEIYVDKITFTNPGTALSLGLTNLRNYCLAYNIFISGTIDNQQAAARLLQDLADIANSAPVFDGAALDFVPYCEQSNYGNGTSYVAPTASGPIFNLTSKDFLPIQNKAPVELTYDRAKDNFNALQVGFKDARAQWTDNFIIVSDSMDVTVQGHMNTTQKNFSYLTNSDTAQAVGYPLLRRALLTERKEFKFKLPAYWSTILTPMDLITIAEPSLSNYPIPVRLKTLTFDKKMELECTAEPFIYGASSPLVPGATGGAQGIVGPPNGNNPPGPVNTPIFIEATPKLSITEPQIWSCVSGAGAYWGGAVAYISTDGGITYSQIGVINARQTMGATTTGTYPNHADPDSANSLYVSLTESLGQLFGVSATQQNQFFPSLCYLNGGGTLTDPNGNIFTIPYELIAYQNATLTGSYQYEMGAVTSTPIRRGVLGTPTASHAIGTAFSYLSDGNVLKITMPNVWIGVTLYFKFTSFNTSGGNTEALSDVTAYPFTPTGQVGWMQPEYSITPVPTVYQGQAGGWPGIDTNSATWTNVNDVYFPPVTASWTDGTATKYAARDAGIAVFSGAGQQAWVTIYDPTRVGDFGAPSQLPTYADLNQTRWNTPGYIRIGTLTSVGGGGGSGGGGGTNGFTIIQIPSTTRGNFSLAHGLGTAPTDVVIQMNSDGLIRFQSTPMPPWDATNIYLNASDDGLTGFLEINL